MQQLRKKARRILRGAAFALFLLRAEELQEGCEQLSFFALRGRQGAVLRGLHGGVLRLRGGALRPLRRLRDGGKRRKQRGEGRGSGRREQQKDEQNFHKRSLGGVRRGRRRIYCIVCRRRAKLPADRAGR